MSGPTTTVIGRVKNKAGAMVEITKTTEHLHTYTNDWGRQVDEIETKYGWHCQGCGDQHSGWERKNQRYVSRDAQGHANRCRVTPAR